MELRQLRYFVTIAEEGNLSRAARRLHVSQPPLSTQMKSLENELGVRLLERSNRGVSLTAAGSVFFEETRAVLARLEHAKTEARRADRGDTGMLSIGFVSIADYGILPPALRNRGHGPRERNRRRFNRQPISLVGPRFLRARSTALSGMVGVRRFAVSLRSPRDARPHIDRHPKKTGGMSI